MLRKTGNWIAALAVDAADNWMVCGGGANTLSLWHLASLNQTATMETTAAVQAVMFSDDSVCLWLSETVVANL